MLQRLDPLNFPMNQGGADENQAHAIDCTELYPEVLSAFIGSGTRLHIAPSIH
jgi:hypothetical protein